MHDSAKRLVALANLERLQGVRIKVCESRYQEKKRKCDEAARSVNDREASIFLLKEERSGLFSHLGQEEVATVPERIERVHARRYWVEYDLEKDEYYLEMDREDLKEAESQLSLARRDWLRAQKRQDLLQQQLIHMRRNLSRRIEEREMED